jgi:succinyl-diaminopimelate desuccinylase
MLDTDLIDSQLLQTVHRFQPQLVACCQRLLQIPSVNGVDDEVHLAEAIAAQAEALGLHTQIVGANPRRPNVIVSTAPEEPTGLLLLGHLDTVPPGDPQQWMYPPFSGTIADGRIYGRGAIDTKGGMTAALYALAALKRTPGAIQTGRVQLLCLPDEESGATGTLGIKFLHANGLLNGVGAIYAYSGDEITLGHRGLIRYRLICTGEAIHTGAADWQDGMAGANAITGMARLLLELEQVNTTYSSARYFERFKTVLTPGTVISGGISINVVPNHCEALVDVRLTPEYDLDWVDTLLRACIDRVMGEQARIQFSYELLNYVPAAISEENAPVFRVLEEAVRQVKGTIPQRVVAGPANEGYLLIERSIPTVCGFGPSGANAHAVDEYVEIQSLVDTASIFCLTARRLSHYVTESSN